jgi:peptidoglycan hydrolase CwlO-like protein
MNQETCDKVISLLEEMQADIKVANGKLDRIDSKFDRIDDKLDRVDDKINRINNELDKLDNLLKNFNERISIGGK